VVVRWSGPSVEWSRWPSVATDPGPAEAGGHELCRFPASSSAPGESEGCHGLGEALQNASGELLGRGAGAGPKHPARKPANANRSNIPSPERIVTIAVDGKESLMTMPPSGSTIEPEEQHDPSASLPSTPRAIPGAPAASGRPATAVDLAHRCRRWPLGARRRSGRRFCARSLRADRCSCVVKGRVRCGQDRDGPPVVEAGSW
jgi:hypothetical protein